MKYQHIYKTNIDYELTLEFFCTVGYSFIETPAGGIRFKVGNINVILFPSGKTEVAFTSEKEKQEFIPRLEEIVMLRKGEGTLVMTPISGKTNIYNIPCPPPKNFNIPYCSTLYNYGLLAVRDTDEINLIKNAVGLLALPENKPMSTFPEPKMEVPTYLRGLIEQERRTRTAPIRF